MDSNDEQLKQLLKLSKVELPFEDFDERMMRKIEQTEQAKELARSYRKKALIFFFVGTLIGFASNYAIAEYLIKIDLSPLTKNYITTGSQIVYVILIVLLSSAVNKLFTLKRESY